MTDVELVRATTQALAELDHRVGSGYVRPVVVSCLSSVLSGLMDGSYGETTGRQLFAAAARLTEFAGYTALDTGQPGLAQRYYIQALRLAQAADDRCYGGYVLAAGLSHLAVGAGCSREAVQLARAAQEGTRGRAPLAAQAMFYASEARGYAMLGDARMCKILADKAMDAMAHVVPGTVPNGSHISTGPIWPTRWPTVSGISSNRARPPAGPRKHLPGTRGPGCAAVPSTCCCWPPC